MMRNFRGGMKHKRQRNTAGFTLVELAIVMGIAALVLGVVWATAATVWSNHKVYVAGQQLLAVAQNIRNAYTNASQLPTIAGNDITTTIEPLDVFPIEMHRTPSSNASVIDDPFNKSLAGGSFHVFNLNNKPPYFRVQMLGLDPGPCTALLMEEPITNTSMGVVGVGTGMGASGIMGNSGTNSVKLDYMGNATNNGTAVTLPLLSATATSWCSAGAGANEVDWDFKLR